MNKFIVIMENQSNNRDAEKVPFTFYIKICKIWELKWSFLDPKVLIINSYTTFPKIIS